MYKCFYCHESFEVDGIMWLDANENLYCSEKCMHAGWKEICDEFEERYGKPTRLTKQEKEDRFDTDSRV